MKLMTHIGTLILIIGLPFSSFNQKNQTTTTEKYTPAHTVSSERSKDRDEIQTLIRQVLHWADSDNSIDLIPVVTDKKETIYIGFDLAQHKKHLDILKSTNFFATEFIENYDQIILTLDKRLRNGANEPWLVGDLPTFNFASEVNPWCMCQDNLDWNTVEVKIISIDQEKGVCEWFWGNINSDTDAGWKDFRYRFNVKREGNKWKIAYLEGFDFKESTR